MTLTKTFTSAFFGKIIPLICLLNSYSCNNEENNDITNYKIDLKSHLESSFEEFLTINSIITLETTEESLLKGIDKIIVRDSLMYIFKDRGLIKVFDLNGNYKRSIGKKGKGLGELITPTDFDLSPDGNRIAIWDRDGAKLSYYTKEGQFIKSVNNHHVNWGFRFCWMDDNKLLFSSLYRKQKDGTYQVYQTDTTLSLFKGKLPYQKRFEGLRFMGRVFQKQSDGNVLFRHPIESTVFDMGHSCRKHSILDFEDLYLSDERKQSYIKNNNLLTKDSYNADFAILWDYLEEENWVYAWYHISGKSYSMIIDKETHSQRRYKHTASLDYLSDVRIIGNYSNQLIASVNPFQLKEKLTRLSGTQKDCEKIKRWNAVLNNVKDTDNPIILLLEPKEV